jgi:hypothetical protein
MTERNPYSQYNYDNFDQPPQRRRPQKDSFRSRLAARFTNPVFATAALLLTGAAFAGIIAISYPDVSSEEAGTPIIQADAGVLREVPANPGGMEIPHQDSTIFNSIRSTEMQEGPPVEDLLAEQKPIDKLEAFAKEAESLYDTDSQKAAAQEPAAGATAAAPAPVEITEDVENVDIQVPTDVANDNPGPKTIKIEQEVQKIPPQAAATQAAAGQVKPAGSAPETLAFVKSVLQEKDSKKSAATVAPLQATATSTEIQKIEPAAGAASAGKTIATGSYYVQLGSVTMESGVPGEWKKLQKAHPSLATAQYRVQKADLGEKGTRFRIQAGPMDKTMAASVCDSIKAQKPGGCLVVQ